MGKIFWFYKIIYGQFIQFLALTLYIFFVVLVAEDPAFSSVSLRIPLDLVFEELNFGHRQIHCKYE